MNKQKKALVITGIFIGLLVIVGGSFFYINSGVDNLDTDGVNEEKDTSNNENENIDTADYLKFWWNTSITAPQGYPSEFTDLVIELSDGSSVGIPTNKVVDSGWGESGPSYLIGDPNKPLPVKVTAEWFSYWDNTFYSGEFVLDDLKIKELFQNGFDNPFDSEENVTFNTFLLGVAPGGDFSIWLSAHGIRIEAGLFNASATSTDWTKVLDTDKMSRAEYVDLVLSELLTPEELLSRNNNPEYNGQWGDFSQRFPWEIEIVGKPLSVWVEFVNGERVLLDDNFQVPFPGFESKSAPKSFMIDWEATSGETFRTRIGFEEEDIFSTFVDFSESINDKDFILNIGVDSISLVSGDVVVPVTNFTQKITQL